ncbi:MAG: HAD family hydrolase [Halobacteria archaeon]|nr:HAD family hydrolase [Halobacteria archaeon]
MFDHYIFDLDGVLVDVTDEYKREVFDEVAGILGDDFTDDQIMNLWHGLGGNSRDDILRSWGYDDPREFWEVFDDVDTPERRIDYTFAYDDAGIIKKLDADMGVVTHSPPELAEPALEKAGLYENFDSIVSCSYDIGYKPAPEPIHKCAREIGADVDSTVMIGDSVSDVKGAWNAGITAGHIDRVGHSIDADINIESLEEVPKFASDGGYRE